MKLLYVALVGLGLYAGNVSAQDNLETFEWEANKKALVKAVPSENVTTAYYDTNADDIIDMVAKFLTKSYDSKSGKFKTSSNAFEIQFNSDTTPGLETIMKDTNMDGIFDSTEKLSKRIPVKYYFKDSDTFAEGFE